MMKHRKLFSTSKDNSTLSCPDICNSTCPYGCDPYTDVYTEPNLSAKQHKQISPAVIIVVILLASCILLVSCYFIVVKYFYGRIRFRPWQRQQETTEAEFLDENHGPTIDHPIWYINTIGLQPSVIDSITIIRYKKSDNLIEGTECAVCLNEFQNDDSLRLLPKCSHAFHITCIDTWLRSHTNCPVCRAGIISATAPAVSNGLNSNNMVVDEDSREENLVNDEESNANQVRDNVFLQNRADTGESIEFPQVLGDGPGFDTAKMSIISKGNTASWWIDDLNNKFMNEGENYRVQSMRRSVSVDSILAENISDAVLNLCLAEGEDVSVDENTNADPASSNIVENSRTSRILNGGSSIAQFLHKKPVKMKRSFSYAGRSFLSRQNSSSSWTFELFQASCMTNISHKVPHQIGGTSLSLGSVNSVSQLNPLASGVLRHGISDSHNTLRMFCYRHLQPSVILEYKFETSIEERN